MRIAIDLRRIRNPGIGHYMLHLVGHLAQEDEENNYILIFGPEDRSKFAPAFVHLNGNFRQITDSSPYYSFREQFSLPLLLQRERVDLFHSPHFLLPLFQPCPAVATIHDVIYLVFPEDLPSLKARWYYRGVIFAGARIAGRIITDSNFSKEEIVKHLRVPEEKIEVIPLAAAPAFRPIPNPAALEAIKRKYHIAGDYILYVGIWRHRKNLLRLIKAFHMVRVQGKLDCKLVMAGPPDERYSEIPRLAQELGLEKEVIFTGYVPDEDLPLLYNAAKAFAFPSLYEGFGLPLLEAMACGTPVLTSRTSSLPEVAGEAALFVDPYSVEEIAAGLHCLLTDEARRAELQRLGLAQAARFNWQETAHRTLAVYKQVGR